MTIGRRCPERLRAWWRRHRELVLRAAILVMIGLAAEMLAGELWRLVFSPGPGGAVDLKLRHVEVRRWFSGSPVYSELKDAVYPPATYSLLWPLIGWLSIEPARWLWAGTSILALGGLTYLIIRQCRPLTVTESVLAALMMISTNAVGVTIGNGQLLVHVLPSLLAGILLLRESGSSWRRELSAVVLLLFSLVKLNGTAPFYWIVLFLPRHWRAKLAVAAGYIAATLVAVRYQPSGLKALLGQWLSRASAVGARDGYGHLGILCTMLGVEGWLLPGSLVILLGLGAWTFRYRRCDLWILLGVAGIVARLWTYHHLYDDILVVFPMVALLRQAKRPGTSGMSDLLAGLLLGLALATTLTPTRLFYSWPRPWPLLFSATHVIVWFAVLAFLLQEARSQRTSPAKAIVGPELSPDR